MLSRLQVLPNEDSKRHDRHCGHVFVSAIYQFYPHRCGTPKLASPKFTILTTPSPRISPLAKTITGVSSRFLQMRQYQLTSPPIALASVNDGTLYMPTATAIPPGTQSTHPLPLPLILRAVRPQKSSPAPRAHCHAIAGRPLPVTSRAVKIQT